MGACRLYCLCVRNRDRSGCGSNSCLRKGGDHLDGNPDLHQSVHGYGGLGGPQGPEFQQALSRLLGWRPDLSRADHFAGAGHVDLGERIQSARPRTGGEERKLRKRRMDGGGETGEPDSPGFLSAHAQRTRVAVRRRNALLHHGRFLLSFLHVALQMAGQRRILSGGEPGGRFQGSTEVPKGPGLQHAVRHLQLWLLGL